MAELTEPIDVDGKARRAFKSVRLYLDIGGDWLASAARLPGKSLHLAIGLQLIASSQIGREVVLSNLALQRFGLDRNAKYRALAWLEEARLVSVERKLGRSPTVTILDRGGPA